MIKARIYTYSLIPFYNKLKFTILASIQFVPEDCLLNGLTFYIIYFDTIYTNIYIIFRYDLILN